MEQISWISEPDAKAVAPLPRAGSSLRRLRVASGDLALWDRPSTPTSSVVMSNEFARARLSKKLSTHAERMLRIALSKIERETSDLRFGAILIRPTELRWVFRGSENSKSLYQDVKEVAGELQSLFVVQTETNPGNGEPAYRLESLLDHCEYRNARLELVFKDTWKPHLLHLRSHFFSERLDRYAAFRRASTFRLYDFLRSYVDVRRCKGTVLITVDEFRRQWGLDDTYRSYKDLRRGFIEPNVNDIVGSGAMKIAFEVASKEGNTVTAIRFNMEIPEHEDTAVYSDVLCANLAEWGVKVVKARELVQRHGPIQVLDKLTKFEAESPRAGGAKKAGWIVSAIERDFKPIDAADNERRTELMRLLGHKVLRFGREAAIESLKAQFVSHLETLKNARVFADQARRGEYDENLLRSLQGWIGRAAIEDWRRQAGAPDATAAG